MSTSMFKRNKIRTGAELSHFVESNFPVDVKECSGKWRYLENNELAASVSGLTATDRIGMSIQDIGIINHMPQATIEEVVQADHSVSVDKAPVTLLHTFLDKPEGIVVSDKVVKQAVVGHSDKMVGILSYAQSMIPYMSRNDLYSVYRSYYTEEEAIQKFLIHMDMNTFFLKMPVEIELAILLYGQEERAQLSHRLKLPVAQVRAYQDRIKDKLVMIDYLELVQRLQVPKVVSSVS